jgi:GNAT superfamily N-acetyltransferase
VNISAIYLFWILRLYPSVEWELRQLNRQGFRQIHYSHRQIESFYSVILIRKMYDYIVLSCSNAASYRHLTYFWLQERLYRQLSLNLATIAIGVALKGQPVGLVLAEYQKDRHHANVLSLVIAQDYRRQGLGTGLLIQIEELLKEQGCKQIDFIYDLNLTTPIIERMLDRQSWMPGSIYGFQCLTNREMIEQAPFLNRYTLPSKYTIFAWADLTTEEQTKIKHQDNGLIYPDELCPFREGWVIAPSSVGLRYKDEVIGWNIVHQLTSDYVSFSARFVKADFRSIGLGIHLLAASINRQGTDKNVDDGMFMILKDNVAMVKFMNRHMSPYLTAINTYWKSSKLIQWSGSSNRSIPYRSPSTILS